MKGVITAGGLGTRLFPLTKITNKHLLPVYDRPMIHFPILKMVEAGIDDVLIVTGGTWADDFARLLGNGRDLGLRHLAFVHQEGEGGIAAAVALAEEFAASAPLLVLLGDNIFTADLKPHVRAFAGGAQIFLTHVANPGEYGVVELDGRRIVSIEEKPAQPRSDLAVTGIYLYDRSVFEVIRGLSPSARSELEITDVNRAFLAAGTLRYAMLPGFWADAGDSLESYFQAIREVRRWRGRGDGEALPC